MSTKKVHFALLALMGGVLLSSSGCFWVPVDFGPTSGIFAYPIPVSPFFQHKQEEKFYEHERYDRVPILGPVTSGDVIALDPPTPDEVMRALEKARPTEGGLPFLHEVQRNNVRMIIEPIADYLDPPRVYPLIGPAQQHHAHYRCTLYLTETTRVGWPVPYTTVDEDTREVVYIDHNHLHVINGVDGGVAGNYGSAAQSAGKQ